MMLRSSRTLPGSLSGLTIKYYDLINGTATFGNGEKLLARLCFLGEKLTSEQAAGILFAVRHTPVLKAQVFELCGRVLDEYSRSRMEEYAVEGRGTH